MRRKRLLCVTEWNGLSTGYASITHGLLSSLYSQFHEQIEIAELACYVKQSQLSSKEQPPWIVYPNVPESSNDFAQDRTNFYGKWRFDEVCLDFLPHFVLDFRDFWMFSYQEMSPARPYFNWILCPTVDSQPQNSEWIETLQNAEILLPYSKYGENILKNEIGISTHGLFRPAAYEELKPIDGVRSKMGIKTDSFIIGTVMRNQLRKLFPDLFDAFAKLIHTLPPEKAKKTYLYCHTAYPDIGWNIPDLLKRCGVSNKILFTYICSSCGLVFPSCYLGVYGPCPSCDGAVYMPNSHRGVSRQIMASIYNVFDVYVQYSTCEGFGMPVIEAAFCGVPSIVVNYSAMEDFVREIYSIPIPVKRFFFESGIGAYRALPDNDHFVQTILQLHSSEYLKELGKKSRNTAIENYSYVKTAQTIGNLILSHSTKNWLQKRNINFSTEIPSEMSTFDFVKYCLTNVACFPELVHSHFACVSRKNLENGFATKGEISIPYLRDNFISECDNLRKKVEEFEDKKWKKLKKLDSSQLAII
ncbi:MAG: glycosyltransferase [Endomicrobiia bacterium]